MSPTLARRIPAALLAISLVSAVSAANAETAPRDDLAAAARAFEQAQAALLANDPARAATLFELADHIKPSPEALRSAARARMAAGQPAVAATHAETMLWRYAGDAATRQLAARILGRTRRSLTRVTATCRERCTVTVDGQAIGTAEARQHVFYVTPGEHHYRARFASGATVTETFQRWAGGWLAPYFHPSPEQPVRAPSRCTAYMEVLR